MSSTESILPPNATELETAVDIAAAKQINDIPVNLIFDQWDPYKCPIGLLGWLAWAVSVDDWNPDWPEQIKRDVIAESVEVHRKKGTPGGVKQALSALAIKTEISEWHDDVNTRTPHTFSVMALANNAIESNDEALIDQSFYDLVNRHVENNKAERSQFDIRIGAAFAGQVGIASAIGCASVVSEKMSPVFAPTRLHNSGMAFGSTIRPMIFAQLYGVTA